MNNVRSCAGDCHLFHIAGASNLDINSTVAPLYRAVRRTFDTPWMWWRGSCKCESKGISPPFSIMISSESTLIETRRQTDHMKNFICFLPMPALCHALGLGSKSLMRHDDTFRATSANKKQRRTHKKYIHQLCLLVWLKERHERSTRSRRSTCI